MSYNNKKFIVIGGKRRKTRLYNIWIGMRRRCRSTTYDKYLQYGGRGIRVCDAWDNLDTGFENFWEWSKANGYRGDLSIDRIDVNGNYEPDNCRWADKWTQVNNRTTSVIIEYAGEELPLATWAKVVNIPRDTLHKRLFRLKWSIERTLTVGLFPGGAKRGVPKPKNQKRNSNVVPDKWGL